MIKSKFNVGEEVIFNDKSYDPERFGKIAIVTRDTFDYGAIPQIAVRFLDGKVFAGLYESRYIKATKLHKALL